MNPTYVLISLCLCFVASCSLRRFPVVRGSYDNNNLTDVCRKTLAECKIEQSQYDVLPVLQGRWKSTLPQTLKFADEFDTNRCVLMSISLMDKKSGKIYAVFEELNGRLSVEEGSYATGLNANDMSFFFSVADDVGRGFLVDPMLYWSDGMVYVVGEERFFFLKKERDGGNGRWFGVSEEEFMLKVIEDCTHVKESAVQQN